MDRRSLLAAALVTPTVAAIAAQPARAAGGGKAKGKEDESNRSYVTIDTLTASILRPTGVRGVITVEAGVDVPDATLRRRLNLSAPRLRAAYIEFLQSYVAGLSRGAPVNADYLAVQFQRRTDQVMGGTGAKFLIGSILMN